jgi:hypothetical protein
LRFIGAAFQQKSLVNTNEAVRGIKDNSYDAWIFCINPFNEHAIHDVHERSVNPRVHGCRVS